MLCILEGSACDVLMNARTPAAAGSAAWRLAVLPGFPPFWGAVVDSFAAVRNGALQSVRLVFKKGKQN